MITSILPQIAVVCVAAFAAAIILAKVKRASPMTLDDAAILWKLHKQNSGSQGHKMDPVITKRGEITGFTCQCGYRCTQKRPLLSKAPKIALEPSPPSFQNDISDFQNDLQFSSARARSKSALK